MLKKSALIFMCAALGAVLIAPSAKAVTVGPPRLQYSVDPGSTFEGKMFLMNENNEEQTFYSSFERFTEDNGQKVFTKETSDLSTWFVMSNQVTLKPKEQQFVPFKIVVPQNAAPGGHFAVIWWSTTPPGPAGSQVAIVTRAGVLVYLTVSGDIHEGANIEDFNLERGASIFANHLPSFSYGVRNTGNVSINPTGNITIKNLFGGTSATLPANKDLAAILPQSRKGFGSAWDDGMFHFGIYHAVLSLTYGSDKNAPLTASKWFILLPWQGFVPFVLIILAILFAPTIIRRYNHWIIEKARRNYQ